jgi:hypothetical protein
MMKRWIAAFAGFLIVQMVLGSATAAPRSIQQRQTLAAGVVAPDGPPAEPRVKRIGYLYPVQGVFVSYCTDTNDTSATPDCRFTYSSKTWKNLPGANYTFTLPAATVSAGEALIFARFSAQTGCTGGSGDCRIRMVVLSAAGTTLMAPTPAVGGLSFDSTGDDQLESHAAEQVVPFNVGPGTYTVKVQVSTVPFQGSTIAPTFDIRSWTLSTETAFNI